MKLPGVPMAIVVFGTLSGVHAQQPPPRTVAIHTIGQQVPISDPTYAFAGVYFLSNGGANALAVMWEASPDRSLSAANPAGAGAGRVARGFLCARSACRFFICIPSSVYP